MPLTTGAGLVGSASVLGSCSGSRGAFWRVSSCGWRRSVASPPWDWEDAVLLSGMVDPAGCCGARRLADGHLPLRAL